MRAHRSSARTLLLLALLPCALTARVGADDLQPEAVPPSKASEVLRPDLLKGPNHTVRETGVTERLFTRWELESTYGLFVCPSTRLLEVRVHEIEAMAKVVDSDPQNEFLVGLKGSLVALPNALVKIIDDPLGTAEGFGQAAERTLGRVGDLFGKRKKSKYEEGGVDAMLFAADKRKVAAELQVDPYSTNSKLQEFLGSVAKARRAGSLAVDLGKMMVPGGAGMALSGLSWTATVTDLLRDKTPAELDRIADEQMKKAGVMSSLRRQFLSNPALSPRHRTTISQAVASLSGVADAGALVAAAVETQTEAQALLHEVQAAYLVRHHAMVEPLARLDVTGGVVAAFTASGKMLVPVPVDVLSTSPEVGVAADALLSMGGAAEAPSRTLWITGRATPNAAAYLRERGFDLVEKGVLPPPPR